MEGNYNYFVLSKLTLWQNRENTIDQCTKPEMDEELGGHFKVDLVSSKVSLWQGRQDDLDHKLKSNPFSDQWEGHINRRKKEDSYYGTPIEGTLTEHRGQKAKQRIDREILEICQLIVEYGSHQVHDGSYVISFGKLFKIYTKISDKVVGMLVRARRRNLVQFEGEMLYQNQDEDVLITCFYNPEIMNISSTQNGDIDYVPNSEVFVSSFKM